MKRFISIATPILSFSWLVVLFLVPSNTCTEYSMSFFTAFFRQEGGFWGFLVSPFVALLLSAIFSLVALISSFTESKTLLSSVVWNGYLIIQLLIHLHHFYGVDQYMGLSSKTYFIFMGVMSGLFVLLTTIYILRTRIEIQAEKAEAVTSAALQIKDR